MNVSNTLKDITKLNRNRAITKGDELSLPHACQGAHNSAEYTSTQNNSDISSRVSLDVAVWEK